MSPTSAAVAEEQKARKAEEDAMAMKIMAFFILVILYSLYRTSGVQLFETNNSTFSKRASVKSGKTAQTSDSIYTRPTCVDVCLAGELECPKDCMFMPKDRMRRWLANTCTNFDKDDSSGCWFLEECKNAKTKKNFCGTEAVAGTVCGAKDTKPAVDARGDTFCHDYNKLCIENGKTLKKCYMHEPLLGLPSRYEAEAAIKDMCATMHMPGCSCDHDGSCPHPIERYANLCAHMSMPQCKMVEDTCKTLSKRRFDEDAQYFMETLKCPQRMDMIPEMKMYFHWGIHEYIIFEWLVPRTIIEYFAACATIVMAGIFSTLLKGLRHRRQQLWNASPLAMHRSDPNCGLGFSGALSALASIAFDNSVEVLPSGTAGRLLARNVTRAGFTCVITVIDYGLMLLAMTFNGGFLLSVILSFGLGQVLYGHWFHDDIFLKPTSRDVEAKHVD
ncbi:Protein P80 [Hondaea fermentalgiana]|uniref:Copper transport protein n=1 Tax=Hondaea fermentalgiana TaxID=2315210 RepID=A0A2R5G0G1_9STRA|nr:Protein P80 [Hondaea fermentalgiana]|eukprot:GBG24502.1 Protein P80 [Hondaea fermentalgiana]